MTGYHFIIDVLLIQFNLRYVWQKTCQYD